MQGKQSFCLTSLGEIIYHYQSIPVASFDIWQVARNSHTHQLFGSSSYRGAVKVPDLVGGFAGMRSADWLQLIVSRRCFGHRNRRAGA